MVPCLHLPVFVVSGGRIRNVSSFFLKIIRRNIVPQNTQIIFRFMLVHQEIIFKQVKSWMDACMFLMSLSLFLSHNIVSVHQQ